MGRCYRKGLLGDEINAILTAAGLNLRKLLRGFDFALISWLTRPVDALFAVTSPPNPKRVAA
jgi:hypothetical protein